MARPDSKEIELISQLRTKVSDLNLRERFNTDHFLIRWIRARQHDLNHAEKMLRAHMKWREELDMDNICTWPIPDGVLKEAPMELLGYDDNNTPVLFLPVGAWGIKEILDMEDNATLLRVLHKIFEIFQLKSERKCTREGYPVTQVVIVIDYQGMSYWNVLNFRALEIRRQIIRSFEANLPETIKSVYVVNCKAVFAAIFAIIKPLLSSATLGKINIFNSNEEKWRQALLEKLSPSVLTPYLGGTNQNTIKQNEFLSMDNEWSTEEKTSLEFFESHGFQHG